MDEIEVTQVMENRGAENGKVFTDLETDIDEETPKLVFEKTTCVEDDIPHVHIARMIKSNEGIR